MEPVPQKENLERFRLIFPNHCRACSGVGYTLEGRCDNCLAGGHAPGFVIPLPPGQQAVGVSKCPTCMVELKDETLYGECCEGAYKTFKPHVPRYLAHVEHGAELGLMMLTEMYHITLSNLADAYPERQLDYLVMPVFSKQGEEPEGQLVFSGNLFRPIIAVFVNLERRLLNAHARNTKATIAEQCNIITDLALTLGARVFSLGHQAESGVLVSAESISEDAVEIKQKFIEVLNDHIVKPSRQVKILTPGRVAFNPSVIKD